ncbi:MAG: transglutaminase domain-containing protein, partial [Clostridia bacterium]|nr:transglutaminase domain-containing protein [Clostridia bacterium]
MTPEIKRFISKLGGLIMAWLFATGMSLMFVNGKGVYPSAAFVMGYALIGAAVLLILGLGRKSFWLTLSALIIASVAAVISGWRPISLLRELSQAQMEAEYAAYIDRIALAAALLLMVIAYVLSFDKHGVFVLLAIALAVSAVMWFLQRDIKVQYTFLPLLAISAQFSVSGAVKQNNLKALLSASVIAAIVSCAVVPSSGVTFEPLEKASENLLKSIIEFFNLDRNDVEERRTFNLITYGWRTQYDAFGGPARPVSDEIMRVKTDETLYLRGSIRYTYNGSAWVDESNSDKAGKIKRYMTTGLEGRIYRSEYESAFDLDKTELLGSLFAHKTADVEILSDNQYWSIYTPNRTDNVSGDNIRVYYNNIGEMFASRQLTADDRYEISYYSFDGDELMLHEAVAGAAYRSDSAYQAARLLNLDVPEGVDARLFALVNNIISGSPDEYSRAEAICEYLRSHGTYTLNADYVPPNEDFVSNFVLGDMRGYCVHFAASMTLMCRMAGLPARYVEGYLVKPDSDGETLVTGKDAHAWCEVYFKGFGWVTFEATPPEGNSAQGNDDDDSFPGDGLPQNEQGSDSPEPT